MITELNESNFDTETGTGTVLVDFWAAWCGPCRAQSPILSKLDESGQNVKICKLNVDENPELSNKFGIISIPTLIVFKDGKVYKKALGLHSLEQLKTLIN